MTERALEIQRELEKLERRHGIKILLAVESGSRAWGFASPDSDFDVRFIYLRPWTEYVRVDPVRDVIEWKLDEVLDINGWDVSKALLALGKGNANLQEWLHSPVVYRRDSRCDLMEAAAERYFSEKAALHHYYGTANSTYKGFLSGERVKYKKYFYALRPLLCCRWIERYHEAPPVAFDELLGLFDEPEEGLSRALQAQVQELLRRKAVTEERDLKAHMPLILDFIRSECQRQRQLAQSTPDDRQDSFEALNAAFRALIGVPGC